MKNIIIINQLKTISKIILRNCTYYCLFDDNSNELTSNKLKKFNKCFLLCDCHHLEKESGKGISNFEQQKYMKST